MFIVKKKSTLSILILIDRSYGEIDWILPVCSYIKRNFSDVKLYALFNSFDSNEIMKGNKFLYDLFLKNVDDCYTFKDFTPIFISVFIELANKIFNHERCPKSIRKSGRIVNGFFVDLLKNMYYKKMVEKIKPNILLKDTSNDTGMRKKVVEMVKKNGGRDIMFPHASSLYHTKTGSWEGRFFADHFLCNTEWMASNFSKGKKGFTNKTHVVGIPRYDKWWIKYLTKQWEDYVNEKYYSLSDKTVFLVYTYGGHSKYKELSSRFSKDIAVKRIEDIIEVLSSFDNPLIILKPHPRQDVEKLKGILKENNYKNCVINHSHPICLSQIADVIIAMNDSSTILDSLSVEKVTIRFLKNKERRSELAIEKFDLSPVANNCKELKNLVKKNLDNKNNFKLKYVKNFNKIIPSTTEASTKKASKVILQNLD